MHFANRREAGRLLSKVLEKYKGEDVVVYALPRGGVEVAVEIAKRLGASLDLIIPRKVGHPSYPEYAICAVTEAGHLVCNEKEVAALDPHWLKQAILDERAEAKRRRLAYLAGYPPVQAEGKVAVLVDDGIATGLTAQAAIKELRERRPKKIILAVPVIPSDTAEQLKPLVDKMVALEIPEGFLGAISAYYDEFDQVEDEEVINTINRFKPKKATKN
jgi:putative phosphoribosyl transferase